MADDQQPLWPLQSNHAYPYRHTNLLPPRKEIVARGATEPPVRGIPAVARRPASIQ